MNHTKIIIRAFEIRKMAAPLTEVALAAALDHSPPETIKVEAY
jgi:hypothetical protein